MSNADVGSFNSEGGSGNIALDLRTGELLCFANGRFPVSGTFMLIFSIDVVFFACAMVRYSVKLFVSLRLLVFGIENFVK